MRCNGAFASLIAALALVSNVHAAELAPIAELPVPEANQGVGVDELPITPADVARVAALVADGSLNDKLARQGLEGVLAGEGTPDEVVEKRGLKVVSDEGALGTAVDEAIAGNAAIADKIRGGKVAAVGALVGAVMKATRGQADAARVKEALQAGVDEYLMKPFTRETLEEKLALLGWRRS